MVSNSSDAFDLRPAILDAIPIAVMFVAPCWSGDAVTDGLIVYANNSCSETLRIDREKLLGTTLLENFPDLSLRDVWKDYLSLLVTQGYLEFEYQIEHSLVTRYYKARLLHVERGLCITFEDVSDLKLATKLAMEALLKAEQSNRRLVTEIAAKTSLEVELKRQALTDPLTGTLNRRGFGEALNKLVVSAAAERAFLSLITFDIDFFKRINDLYGHEVGDLVLQKVVAETSRFTNRDAVLGRIGGEEFSLALKDVPLTEAMRLADDVRRLLACSFVKVGGDFVKWTISAGVQEMTICGSLDRLCHDADAALMIAKRQGRNMVVGFEFAVEPGFDHEKHEVIYI